MSNEQDQNQPDAGRPVARAHWTIYLPTILVALLWAAFYLRARFGEPEMPAIATLCLLVEAAAVPTLLLLAWGRARNLLVMPSSGDLLLQSGFPLKQEERVAMDQIRSVRLRRGPVQRLLGGGAIVVTLTSGKRIVVNDLDHPTDIAALFIQAR